MGMAGNRRPWLRVGGSLLVGMVFGPPLDLMCQLIVFKGDIDRAFEQRSTLDGASSAREQMLLLRGQPEADCLGLGLLHETVSWTGVLRSASRLSCRLRRRQMLPTSRADGSACAAARSRAASSSSASGTLADAARPAPSASAACIIRGATWLHRLASVSACS